LNKYSADPTSDGSDEKPRLKKNKAPK